MDEPFDRGPVLPVQCDRVGIVVRENDDRVDALGQTHSLQIAQVDGGGERHILWTVPELMP